MGLEAGWLGGGEWCCSNRLADVCSLSYRQPPMFILISPLINLPIAHGVHYLYSCFFIAQLWL